MKSSNFPKANREITAPKVRLVDDEGEMIGVVTLQEALKLALEKGLDLVEISPNADPPVCKILDFGKFKYEAKKKAQEAKKKQKVVEIKEIKIRPNIGQNDYDVKMRSMQKFLAEGDKVKITLRFKGREITHQEIAFKLFDQIKEDLQELCKIETSPRMEGRQMLMIIAPK
jgi:translation initiation factor IF-3